MERPNKDLAAWWHGTEAEAWQYERDVLAAFKQALTTAPKFNAQADEIRLIGRYPETALKVSFVPGDDPRFHTRTYHVWAGHSGWGSKSAVYTAGSMLEHVLTSRS